MSKRSDENQKNDDILRMEDIVPPFRPRKKSENGDSPESAGQSEEIPEFNLAERILAQQRKQTASRRIAPKSARNPPSKPITANSAVRNPVPIVAEQQQIIAEIVARDIERLCGDMSF